jgi:hypothetical protein
MSLENHISEIVSFLVGMGSGSLLTFRLTRKSRDSIGGNSVNQSRATAGGDIVAGDKTTDRR